MRRANPSEKWWTRAEMPWAVRPALSRLRAREGENVWPKGMKTRTTSLILEPLRPGVRRVRARSLSTPGGPNLSLFLCGLLLSLGGSTRLGGSLLLRALLLRRFLRSHAMTSCWREFAAGADCRFL